MLVSSVGVLLNLEYCIKYSCSKDKYGGIEEIYIAYELSGVDSLFFCENKDYTPGWSRRP